MMRVSAFCWLLGLAACSSEAVAPSNSGGGAGAAGNAVGGSTNSAGSAPIAGKAGSSAVTGGGAAGAGPATTGSAGSVPVGGAAGATGTAGTSGRSGTSGGTGTSGTAGAAGSSDSGATAGTSGASSLLGIAAAFDGFRFECPCVDANHFGPDKPENCDNPPAADRQTQTKKLAGDASVIYEVKLHVRGDAEPNTYVKGKLDPNKRFYVGGETSTPGYTAYMLTVADPQQVYFFNYNPSTSHIHFLLDYEVTIPMRGGTTLTFEVNGGKSVPDGHGVSNRDKLVVPGIPPAPDPFNGQLVQFDVVSVQPRQ